MDEADGPTGDDNPKTPTSSSAGSTSAAHDADATIAAPGSPVTPAGISSPASLTSSWSTSPAFPSLCIATRSACPFANALNSLPKFAKACSTPRG
jgi:hypothetical protein